MEDKQKSLGEMNLISSGDQKIRLAFPALWVPTAMKPTKENPNPKKQHSATFLVPKGSKMEKLINDTIDKVAKAAWGRDSAEIIESVKNNTNKSCWINGDSIEKRKLDGYPGNMALTAKNDRRPTVLARDGTQVGEGDEGAPYAGCYVNAQVEIWAQVKGQGAPGLRCSLLGVVYHSKGDSFGGGRVASKDDLADLTSDEGEEDEGQGLV
jgi:hypothetical protein